MIFEILSVVAVVVDALTDTADTLSDIDTESNSYAQPRMQLEADSYSHSYYHIKDPVVVSINGDEYKGTLISDGSYESSTDDFKFTFKSDEGRIEEVVWDTNQHSNQIIRKESK